MSRNIRLFTVALLLSAGSANAQIELHPTYYVGSGAKCDFADIQSAVNAAESNPPTDADSYIYVAAVGAPYAGHLIITKSMSLIGTDTCGDGLPPPNTAPFATINGAGGTDAPVIAIGGASDVSISGLEITGGHAGPNGFGGGIDFSGVGGSLTLSNVVIDVNSAKEGGGLAVTPVGTTVPDVFINDDVQILVNTASDSGGGMYINGSAEVYVMGQRDLIALNNAGVSGGGVFVRNPARLTLGSPGLNGLLVYLNSAQYGGGIAAYANGDTGDDEQQIVSLFTTDPESPGQITANNASVAGGGIYLKPIDANSASNTTVCAQDFRINENSAAEGAALFIDVDGSCSLPCFNLLNTGKVYLNTMQCREAADLHAVPCAADTPCNEISGNTAATGTTASVVYIAGGGITYAEVDAERLVMHENVTGYLFHSGNDAAGNFNLSNLLTGGNSLTNEMIRMEGEHNTLVLQQSTLAPDIINSTHVIKLDNSDSATTLTLLNSIIDEPGTLTLNYPGSLNSNSNLNTGNIISNDVSTLPGNVRTQLGTPLFVDGDNPDASKRNYHLLAYIQNGQVTASPGIDFAEAGSGDGSDLDGNPYDQDVPLVPNFAGPRDLGAYEAQPIADRIFGDAFGDRLSLVVMIK